MEALSDLLRAVDGRWERPASKRIPLRIIGSSALMMQTRHERGTKDGDVLETIDLAPETKSRLLQLAGKGTPLHARHRIYVEFVSTALAFLPQTALYHPHGALNATLRHFEIGVLDVVDVVVAKLARFHADDRSDIEAMVEIGLVPHGRLVARFQAALDFFSGDASEQEFPRYVRNLNTVERDLLGLAESRVELAEWVDR
ncbi:MAG: DUF6036 family nucleotidyltransferase [Polyangiaceae bacterium]